MSEYIKRDEAIKALHDLWKEFYIRDEDVDSDSDTECFCGGILIASHTIAKLPSADVIERKRGEWIPCSERLPNEDEIPYDGIGRKGERSVSDRILAIDKNGFIRTGYFMNAMDAPRFGKRYEFGEHYQGDPTNWIVGVSCRRFDPIAWMPLPKS